MVRVRCDHDRTKDPNSHPPSYTNPRWTVQKTVTATAASLQGMLDEARQSVRTCFARMRRQRAIGVSYKKEREALSHYMHASLTSQFDVWVHVDETTALQPLPA